MSAEEENGDGVRRRAIEEESDDDDAGSAASTSSSSSRSGKKRSKRPTNSAFKQQRLPAWKPVLTAGTALPTFFIVGAVFVPVGIGLLWFNDKIHEISHDYTECPSLQFPGLTCADVVGDRSPDEMAKALGEDFICQCKIPFELEEDWELDEDSDARVYMYYGLTNFYQNHRRYVSSRSDTQLLGNVDEKDLESCEPLDIDPMNRSYVPCGAIANSMFNDDITLYHWNGEVEVPVNLIRTGIAWSSDKEHKFKNPPGDLKEALNGTARPKDWHKDLWELDPVNEDNNGLENEDLIVWMRPAALPSFRKIYRKVAREGRYENGLPKGNYLFAIDYRFRVKQFGGTKSIVLSTTSPLGGNNPFLGIAYVSVGCVCLLMGTIFLFIHIKCRKQMITQDVQMRANVYD